MFFRKYWIPLLVFIVAIVGVGLYALQTRPPKDPILIVTPVEFEKQRAKAKSGDTSQGGHFHEDGTWHAEPHAVEVPVEPPAVAPSEPYLSDAELAEIPEDMLEPDIPLPADLKNVDLETWKQWRDKHQAEWKKYIHALDPAIERLRREVEAFGNLPPENSPDYAAANAKYNAVMSEYSRLITEQGWRIHDANDARQAAREKYRLARFGKK